MRAALIIACLFASVFAVAQPFFNLTLNQNVSTGLRTGLVSYYRIEEGSGTRSDAVGANHLSSTNNVDVFSGRQGNAARFTRASSMVLSAPNTNAFRTTGSFTMALWVSSSLWTANNYHIAGRWGDGSAEAREWVLFYQISSQRFQFYGSTNGTATVGVTANSFGAPTVNTLYFIVCGYDAAANNVFISVNNGTTDTASLGVSPLAVGNARFRIGGRGGATPTDYLEGIVDEVGIWNRLLTAAEKTQLFAGVQYPRFQPIFPGPATLNTGAIYTVNESPRPQVFLDFDLDSDIDDVVDEVYLLNLEHRGNLDIIGAVSTSTNLYSAAAWLAIANYYSRSTIPVGVNTNYNGANGTSLYASNVATNYGVAGKTNATQFDVYTTTQRQTLAAAANSSVEYITTGDLGSVKGLLQTAGDGFSASNGVELVAQKVRSLWIVGNNWPGGVGVSDIGGNAILAAVSRFVLTNWPTTVPIILTSISDGTPVFTGENKMVAMNAANPARVAWELYFGRSLPADKQSGWSQIAITPLTYGIYPNSLTATNYSEVSGYRGFAYVEPANGVSTYSRALNHNHSYLSRLRAASDYSATINALLLDPSAW